MGVAFDEAKRARVLAEREIDISRAGEVFDGFHLTRRDDKHSGREDRFHSVGLLDDVVVIVTWTPRDGLRRIVTMWKASERERARHHEQRDRSG